MTRLGITMVALTLLPAVLAAQTDSSRMRGADSTRRGVHRQTSFGEVGHNIRLNHDQVTQLQTALQQANCNPGSIDGVMGPRTRSAMNCYRKNNNISGTNENDVFRSLNLDFAHPDSLNGRSIRPRMNPGTPPNPNRMQLPRGARSDTLGGRARRPDSLRRPTTRRDTTRPAPPRPDTTPR